MQVFALAASAVFMLPFYKHFMTWIGAAPASRKNLAKLLSMGSVAVIVGGIAEMFMVRKDREEILLRGRRGLMRTAIETRTPIVPVYFLGGSQVLSFGPSCFKPLSRRLRTSIGFVFGRLGLPIPRQKPIHMVSGKLLWPGAALSHHSAQMIEPSVGCSQPRHPFNPNMLVRLIRLSPGAAALRAQAFRVHHLRLNMNLHHAMYLR